MGLSRLGSNVGKSGAGTVRHKQLTARYGRALLPALHRHTQGKPFGPQAFRAWLRRKLAGKGFQLPTVEDAGKLLRNMVQSRGDSSPPAAWKPHGVKYDDPEGSGSIRNIRGFQQLQRGTSSSSLVSWHEYGSIYRLHRSEPLARGTFCVVCVRGFKRLSCAIMKRTLRVQGSGGEKAEFKNSLVINPRQSVSSSLPNWTFIYLHSFSSKGSDYTDFPHYFGVGGAALRVVIPTAPMQEQTCFQDWMVWRGKRLRWRRIKFNSWFDYLTDKAGNAENDLCIKSLIEMRERLHALIRREVQRVGDPKRVIIGGASQGCCLALDVAMTYPEELGGVIGLVGHILGSTPLDPAKKNMPFHLFHEASDREMRWGWVKDTVQRLVDAGFNVTSRREQDPSGCGHWIQDIEGEWIRSALRQIIFRDSSGLH